MGGTFDINDAALSLTQNGVTPSGTHNLVNSTVSGVFGKYLGKTQVGQCTDGSNILVGDRVGQINYTGTSVTVGSFGAPITDITVDPEGRGLTDIYYGYGSAVLYTGVEDVSGSFLYVGTEGGGTATGAYYAELLIAGGKTIDCEEVSLGLSAGNAGKVTVTGSGSTLTCEWLYVGRKGSGSLTITDGGKVTGDYVYIGHKTGSDGEVLVIGSGSSWTTSSSLNVGRGSLTIADGGKVSNPGVGISSGGAVLVTGSGSTWTCGHLRIESGSLTIADDGKVVMVAGNFEIYDSNGALNWNSGTFELNGNADESLTVPNGGLLTGTGTYGAAFTQTVSTGGQSQFTGGPLYTSGGAGYTISGGANYTLANATYNVQPGGSLESDGLWKLDAGAGVSSFIPGGAFILGANNVFTTLGDCVGANALSFGASTGGTININHRVTITALVPNGGLLTGNGTFTAGTTQTVSAGGQSQYTGGPLFTSEGNGYTITGASDHTLATATYNVQPGGALKNENLWEVTATGSAASFVFDGNFTFNTNGDFSTLSDCLGADSLSFGASTGGTININHQATIAAYNAASTSAVVVGVGGKLSNTAALDMRNASNITINIAAGDFVAGRTIADLAASSWMVDPTKVTLNVAQATGVGSVTLATSTGAAAMSTDGTTEIAQADLDSWIAGLSDGYSIGYDGFDLLLNCSHIPPAPGDSNEVVIEKLIASGDIVLPPGMTVNDAIASLTATTGSTLTVFTAAKKFGTTLASRISNSTGFAGWLASNAMPSNNNTLRGQQVLRDYRRGKTSLWMENVGAWTTQDAIDETTTAYNASLLGIQVGADRMLGRNFIAGIAYSGAWATTRSGGQQMTTNIFDLQLYGAWRASQNLRCVGSVGYQYMAYLGEFLGADSSHIGQMFKLAGGLEYDIRLGKALLTPIYGWEYYTTSEDAYQAGQFAIDGNKTEAVYQRCGVRLGLLKRHRIKMDFHSSWLHNFGDENIIFSAASGGTPLQLTGAPVHRDLAEIGLDTNIALTRSLDLTLGYLGVYAPGFNTQSVNGLLRYSF